MNDLHDSSLQGTVPISPLEVAGKMTSQEGFPMFDDKDKSELEQAPCVCFKRAKKKASACCFWSFDNAETYFLQSLSCIDSESNT